MLLLLLYMVFQKCDISCNIAIIRILMIFSNRPEGNNFIIIYITRAIIIIIALQGNNDFTTRAIMILPSKLSPSRAIIIIIALVTNFS